MHTKLDHQTKVSAPVVINNLDPALVCVRCGSNVGVERHHWAPASKFDDFDMWPTAWLCSECHSTWHRRMDGYRFQPVPRPVEPPATNGRGSSSKLSNEGQQ
jgi:hypothetical protein